MPPLISLILLLAMQLLDLDSLNGTWVDGAIINKQSYSWARDGSTIRIPHGLSIPAEFQ